MKTHITYCKQKGLLEDPVYHIDRKRVNNRYELFNDVPLREKFIPQKLPVIFLNSQVASSANID